MNTNLLPAERAEAIEALAHKMDTCTNPGLSGSVWADEGDWVRWGAEILGVPADRDSIEEIADYIFDTQAAGETSAEIAAFIIDWLLEG